MPPRGAGDGHQLPRAGELHGGAQTQLEAGDRVVLVSSMAHWLPFPRGSLWRLKAALSWFANSLRLDWESKGVAVTVVSPGFVDTR